MQEADENGSDGLDIDEFKAAFGQILGKGKKDQQVFVYLLHPWLMHLSPVWFVDGSYVYEDRH